MKRLEATMSAKCNGQVGSCVQRRAGQPTSSPHDYYIDWEPGWKMAAIYPFCKSDRVNLLSKNAPAAQVLARLVKLDDNPWRSAHEDIGSGMRQRQSLADTTAHTRWSGGIVYIDLSYFLLPHETYLGTLLLAARFSPIEWKS